ncbi:Eco57I restriction-modification methylase domain-containing protein [Bacillus velezensis]|uniref:Eco57I restriction-modification methylase domain-containing protein n=1 Tax=Bacillus velezensis TaxID=492670 RepID=UPI002452FE33|nr:TaqI-like C-terminal specificity domain-containing protein [Bacillus velezensis]MDH3100255.1 TaqI-like C-terminal specificity domain-containing protein [Bacillus velezensis]
MIDLSNRIGIADYFVKIGYKNNPIFDFDKSIFEFNYNWIYKIHMLTNTDDFKIWLFEIDELKTEKMNMVAHRLHRRNPFDYNLLIFTDINYKNTVFLHYHKDNDGKIKIRRLRIDKNKLTATDSRILSEIKISGKDIIDDLDIVKIHKDAFDIERVTDKFFEEFKQQIDNFSKSINGLNSSGEKRNYTLLLISRLIFLYFVQKKGWLNGVQDYLYDRFLYCEENGKSYFEEILKPLFFECLNTPFEYNLFEHHKRSQMAKNLYENYQPVIEDLEINKTFKGIPYLNGGLFEPHPQFEINNSVIIDNQPFKSLFQNLLNKYNFTVREDLGYDLDIAVDPELLGRIFENLIIEEERSSTGSFYTPRNIIHEMCKNTLKMYLLKKLTPDIADKVDYLISHLEDENLYSKQKKIIIDEINELTETRDCSIYKLSPNEAVKLLQELKNVKVCDPAVGSGAFLLGMLHIIVELIRKVNVHSIGLVKFNLFDTKREIIQENLYGVDIQEGAIDIARLRLWLSLAVEYDAVSVEDIKPLPNLSYKIIQGNSLFSTVDGINLDKEFDKLGFGQVSLFEEKKPLYSIIDQLILKRVDYFNATVNKKEIEQDIKKLEGELFKTLVKENNSPLPSKKEFFSWKINFPEVFESNGFDIIIGNPPYGGEFNSNEKNYLKAQYPSVADYESSQYFYLKGLDLLKEGGLISYITTNTFIFNVNAGNFRKEILSNNILDSLYDLTEVNVFKKAKVRTVIMYGLKSSSRNYDVKYYDFNPETRRFHPNNSKSAKELLKNDKKWLFMMRFTDEQEELIERIGLRCSPLQKYFDVSQGLIPYDKYRGHSEEIIKKRIWHAEYQKDEAYKPELKGEDVKFYTVKWNGQTWIKYGNWLAAPREPRFFNGPRILVREIVNKQSGRLNAGYTKEEFYNTPSIINIVPKDKQKLSLFYLLGLLNSKLFAIYNYGTSPKAKKGLFPKILVTDVRKLPIKQGNRSQQIIVENLVKKMIKLLGKNSENNSEIENIQTEIDKYVFEIYDINSEDQKLLESIIN